MNLIHCEASVCGALWLDLVMAAMCARHGGLYSTAPSALWMSSSQRLEPLVEGDMPETHR